MTETAGHAPDKRTSGIEGLSSKQKTAVQAALTAGFFERPQRATGADVAEELGISRSTFLYHLRNAERILLTRAVESISQNE